MVSPFLLRQNVMIFFTHPTHYRRHTPLTPSPPFQIIVSPAFYLRTISAFMPESQTNKQLPVE